MLSMKTNHLFIRNHLQMHHTLSNKILIFWLEFTASCHFKMGKSIHGEAYSSVKQSLII